MRTLIILIAIGLAAALAGGAFVYSGVYSIASTAQHTAPVYRLMDVTMRRSVKQHASDIAVPSLDSPALMEQGLGLYRRHCVQCHGAPGVAPDAFALGLNPLPANLAHTARTWPPAELFWVVRQGVKMSGMPAWQFRLGDEEIWAIVAFLEVLPGLSPERYRALEPAELENSPPRRAGDEAELASPGRLAGVDAARGEHLLPQYACITCHEIPGVVGAHVPVGPPLARIGTRELIAGMLPNTPENMVRWLRAPQQVNPRSAMPDLGVSEQDARDIAAYLATLR